MALAHVSTGTVGIGSTSVTPGLPASLATGDGVLIMVVAKPDTATIATPTDWTLVANVAGGGGTTGNGIGPTRQAWFYREKDAGWSTMPAITVTSGSASAAIAMRFTKAAGTTVTPVASTGVYGTGATTTNGSSTHGSAPGFATDDLVYVGYSNMDEAPTWSAQSITATGATFAAATELSEAVETTTGNDIGGMLFRSNVTAGSSTSAPVTAATLSVAGRGTAVAVRLRETSTTPTVDHVASQHTGYGGAAQTSVVLTAPAGISAGHLAMAVITVEQQDIAPVMTITPPSGWTLKTSNTITGGAGQVTQHIYWKWWTGSETATDRTWSFDQSKWRTGFMSAFSWSAGSPSPADPWGGTLATSTGSTATRASMTYDASGDGLGIWIHSQWQDSNAPTLPSGYTATYSSTEHEEKLWTRSDTAGTGLTTGSTTGWAGNHVMHAGTILLSPSNGINVAATAISSALTFGTTTVSTVVSTTATAIASAEAHGSPTATVVPPAIGVTAGSIASGEAVGSPTVSAVVTASPTGIATALAFGTTSVSTVLSSSATGIATAQAVGSPTISAVLSSSATGIATGLAFGTPTISTLVGTSPTGIATAQALGSPTLSSALNVSAGTLATGEVFGSPDVSLLTSSVPSAIASAEVFGAPVIQTSVTTNPKPFKSTRAIHSPLRIESGGTYNGGYASSTDPDVAAITIATDQPVTILNMTIEHVSWGVWAPWTSGQVTVQNCHITALDAAGNPEQQGVIAWEPEILIVENNTFTNAHGVQISGSGFVSTTIRVEKNSFKNIGRYSQPSFYQGAVHLDNVQCSDMKVRWNLIFNERGFSHCEDTIACSNGTSGTLGNEIEVAYNMINGTYPISGDGATFTGGAYDFGDISGGYIIAHHNYALNYTNNGFMIPSGHDIKIHDCVAVYDGLANDGQRVVSTWGWGFTVANLYGGGVSPNTYLQDNRSAHRRWSGTAWETANYQWNTANGGSQDLGGNTIIGVADDAMERSAYNEWLGLVASNSITIGASGGTAHSITTVLNTSPTAIATALAFGTTAVTVIPPGATALPNSITSAEAFGATNVTWTTPVIANGIASALAFGSTSALGVLNVSSAGAIATAVALGSPTISNSLTASPAAIASALAFGTAAITTRLSAVAASISSSEGFGSATISFVTYAAPAGISSNGAFGSPTLTMRISVSPTGIATSLAFGTTVITQVLTVTPVGIVTALVFGSPGLTTRVTLSPDGIASAAVVSNATINGLADFVGWGVPIGLVAQELPVGQGIVPNGIATAESFGTLVANKETNLAPTGVATAAAFGTTVLTGKVTLSPSGKNTEELFGSTTVTQSGGGGGSGLGNTPLGTGPLGV